MNAMHTFDPLYLLDDLHADADALGPLALARGLREPVHHRIGDMHARHAAAHELRRALGAQGAHAHQQVDLLMQSHIPRPAHERLENRHVVAVLGLNELGARLDLFRQTQVAKVLRRHKRVRSRAEEEVGRRRQLAAAQEDAAVTHNSGRAQKVQGVKIEDATRLRLIARAHVVARQAEDVAHAQRGRAQQIALNGDPVAVAATHLQDRLITCPRHQRATCHTAHMAVRARPVRRIDGVAYVPQLGDIGVNILWVGRIRRVQLRGHCEMAGLQELQQAGFAALQLPVSGGRRLV